MDLLDCTVPVRVTRSTGAVHTSQCSGTTGTKVDETTMTLRQLQAHPKQCRNCQGWRRDTILWERARREADLPDDVVVVFNGWTVLHRPEIVRRLCTWAVTHDDPPTQGQQAVLRVDPVTAKWLWLRASGTGRVDGYGHTDAFSVPSMPFLAGPADTLPDAGSLAWTTLLGLLAEDRYRDDPPAAVAAALRLTA